MHMFVLSQRLMILHMSFFVSWLFLFLSYHIYGRHKSEIINVKKKIKKLYFMVFFNLLRTGRFTCFGTDLSVVPIGKLVIPTDILIF
jgi:hypothetical protein